MSDASLAISGIQNAIRSIPDFPKAGILFKDITPLLADATLFAASIDLLIGEFKPGMSTPLSASMRVVSSSPPPQP